MRQKSRGCFTTSVDRDAAVFRSCPQRTTALCFCLQLLLLLHNFQSIRQSSKGRFGWRDSVNLGGWKRGLTSKIGAKFSDQKTQPPRWLQKKDNNNGHSAQPFQILIKSDFARANRSSASVSFYYYFGSLRFGLDWPASATAAFVAVAATGWRHRFLTGTGILAFSGIS